MTETGKHPRAVLRLPRSLQQRLEAATNAFLNLQHGRTVDFTGPLGEEALLPSDSVSWRVCKNPLALFIGGVAAVILELAEPAVRAGIWEHSSFRINPVARLQRTGLAAMATVYGARSISVPMIAGVVRMHERVAGTTAAGVPYSASDSQLLNWVHATAAFGFAQAYGRYVEPLSHAECDALYGEGAPASRLYGALGAPRSSAELNLLFRSMGARLEPSPTIFEFLRIMSGTQAFPRPLAWMQGMLVRAAVELIPDWIRERLGLTGRHGLSVREQWIVRLAGVVSDRVVLAQSPAVQSCVRLGLQAAHLYT
jgi:uncharacterized protein (DUF2236 family)